MCAGKLDRAFAHTAAGLHVLSALALLLAAVVESPGADDIWVLKYPERAARARAMGDFGGTGAEGHASTCVVGCVVGGNGSAGAACAGGCSDAVNMIKARVRTLDAMQPHLAVGGLAQSVACLCAIFALLSAKAHMDARGGQALGRPSMDEQELALGRVCFTCLCLGFAIPLLQFTMMAGPLSFISWVGTSALSGDPDASWSNFRGSDWKVLYMSLLVVESLFLWLDTLMCLLLAIGFGAFSSVAAAQLPQVVTQRLKRLGQLLAVFLFLAFACGLLRHAGSFFEGAMRFFYVSTSMVLLPLWFALLGLGLGGVESIESQHAEFYGNGGGGASELEEGTSADGSGGKPQPQQPEAAAAAAAAM